MNHAKSIAPKRSSLCLAAISLLLTTTTQSLYADSVSEIRDDFDALRESYQELNTSFESLNTRINKSQSYLNQLVAEPTSMTGKNWETIPTALEEMSDEEFDRLLEGNADQLKQLATEDESVNTTMNVFDAQLAANAEFLESTEKKVDSLSTETVDMVSRISDYIDDNKLSALRLTPVLISAKGLVDDVTTLATRLPETIELNTQAIARVEKLKALDGGSPASQPAAPVMTTGASGEMAEDADVVMATVSSAAVSGQWKELGDGGAMMMISTSADGGSSGMFADPGRGISAAIMLDRTAEQHSYYKDSNSGNVFQVTPYDDQVIVKMVEPDGSRSFQIFMERQ